MGAGVGLPGTPGALSSLTHEDVIRQKAQAERMRKFDRESMAQGLVEDPTASGYADAFRNVEEYGFAPPPDVPEYFGAPAQPFAGAGGAGPLLPPMQPFAVDPRTGSRNFPVNLRPDVIGAMGRGEWHNENWQRYERDKEKRGQYVKPPPPGLPPWKFPVTRELPASKVYSDPIPAMFPPGWRPPQPPG